jgi:cytosol alanyl aminopeptidase
MSMSMTTRAAKISVGALQAVLIMATACGARETDTREAGNGAGDGPAEAGAPSGPPTLRLPDTAAPVRYRAALEVDPAATSFRGSIEIDVVVKRDTDRLWLNAQGLTIDKAILRRDGKDERLAAEMAPRSFVALRGAIPRGKSTLAINYHGKQDVANLNGMGRYVDSGDWYVVTHFEPDDARRVFPCFDEPSFKVPWQLTLTVPAGITGLSNTAVEKEDVLPHGHRRLRFRTTRPLPSYLIALAVGPFETVDAGATRHGVPTRIVVPRGRADDAGDAAREVGKVLAFLEDYTGIPYGYGKLDHVVVPGTQRGAMEHPGLVTYGPRFLLIRQGESVAARRAQAGIVAHELAHQWFGNLVTTAWWDDLWLNEAFATWMAPKTIEAVYPEMDGALDPVANRATALAADGLASARRIREPIDAESDMRAAFDRITYSKGATVIRMFERWVGPERFQKAVRAYLAAHTDRNATAADFLAQLDRAAEKPVGAAFATFLEQAGVPEIAMELRCPAGGPATLGLSQRRHVPVGAAPVSGEPRWHVPVCVAVPEGSGRKTHCTLLTEASGEVALGNACPAWVAPNVDGAGYYLAALQPAPLAALLDQGWERLSRVERLALLGDLEILVDGGKADVAALLALLPRLGASDDAYLVDIAIGRLDKLSRFVAKEQGAAFARLVRATLGAAGKRIGWTPRQGEKLAEAKLRGRLMSLLAVEGRDAGARGRAVALTRQWLADHKSVPDSLWGPALQSAVRASPKQTVPALLARLREEEDRVAQRAIYQALAQTPDPALHRKVLELTLTADPIPPEMAQLLGATPSEIERQDALFDFVRDHADELLRRLPEQLQGAMTVNSCDESRRDQVAAFLEQKLAPLPEIGTRAVAQKVESMNQCIARRAAQGKALAAFLSGTK